MGLSNIFLYPRLKRIGGSLGTDGMTNRSRKMISLLCNHKGYIQIPEKLEIGFERVKDDATEVLPTEKDMRSLERLEMTRSLRVIQQNPGKHFENECQEGITAQKLITEFWGCYNTLTHEQARHPLPLPDQVGPEHNV